MRKHNQIKTLIKDVLEKIEMGGESAETLIFGTGLIESNYDYLRQWDDGVARSWFQVEPATALDIINNYLKYRQPLTETCADACLLETKYFSPGISEETIRYLLETNIAYAIIMCRLKYRRIPKRIPETIEGMALYWKTFYNTAQGKGIAKHFIDRMK